MDKETTLFEYAKSQNLDYVEAVKFIEGYKVTMIVDKTKEEEESE